MSFNPKERVTEKRPVPIMGYHEEVDFLKKQLEIEKSF